MKNLSKQAGLFKVYTNHCLRATSITELDRSGFEARHIMSISGHQSESSIRSYSSHVDDNKKLDMAMSISRAITGDSLIVENRSAASSISSSSVLPPLNEDDEENLSFEDMDFLEISNSQEQRLLQTFFPRESGNTAMNQGTERSKFPFQQAPILNINNNNVNVHYHYY